MRDIYCINLNMLDSYHQSMGVNMEVAMGVFVLYNRKIQFKGEFFLKSRPAFGCLPVFWSSLLTPYVGFLPFSFLMEKDARTYKSSFQLVYNLQSTC